MLTFSVYIRFIGETFLLLFLSAVSEIYQNNTSNLNRKASLSFAYMLFTLLLIFTFLMFLAWMKTKKDQPGTFNDKLVVE